jgi:hypothetical protein
MLNFSVRLSMTRGRGVSRNFETEASAGFASERARTPSDVVSKVLVCLL